jgi:hypothetical protein
MPRLRLLTSLVSILILTTTAEAVRAGEATAPASVATTTTAAQPSPKERVRALVASYEREHQTREWSMLNGMGQRMWEDQAVQLARQEPEAMQKAVREGVGPWGALVLILGSVGGDKNVAFLAALAEGKISVPETAKKDRSFAPEWFLVLALGRTRSLDACPALRKLTEFKEPPEVLARGVPYRALEALARIGDPQSVPIFEKWLASDNAKVRRAALGAALYFAGHALADPLRKVDARTEGDDDRTRLDLALVRAGDETYLEKVHAMAQDESEYARQSAEKSPDPAMAVGRPNWTQHNALTALEGMRSPKSLPVLDALARSAADERIRQRAAALATVIRKDAGPAGK